MNYENLLITLGFSPKENATGVFYKEYQQANNYCIEIDFEKNQFTVFYLLYSEQGQRILKANVTGTAQGGLNRNNLENIQIPFSPSDIQQKIVSEIESLEEKLKPMPPKIASNNFKIKREVQQKIEFEDS